MPNVTIKPIQTINVRVNQNSQKIVSSTSQFIGAGDLLQQIDEAKVMAQNAYDAANSAVIIADAASSSINTAVVMANTAITIANSAYQIANNKLDLTGGTITGSLEITQNLIVDQIITANNETIDAGLF
jgi:hypothetical protein